MKAARVVLTDRDRELFRFLGHARWLSTGQIGRLFFPGVSLNAVSKRLRRLVAGGFLFSTRPDRTGECIFRLTRLSADEVLGNVTVPRKLPAQLEHSTGINDIRVWLETLPIPPHMFWAEWDYRSFDAKETQVPDALLAVGAHGHERRLAIEVDCGTENASILAKKLLGYRNALDSGQLSGVVMFLPGQRRIRATVEACFKFSVLGEGRCWVGDFEKLWNMDIDTKAFVNLQSLTLGNPVMDSLNTLLASPFTVSCRRERISALTAEDTGFSAQVDSPMYSET